MVTVQSILDYLKQDIQLPENTVDQLIYGKPDDTVTGVAVMFMPTVDALKDAISKSCNLILTHEGVFNSHWHDATPKNPVHKLKDSLIRSNQLNIFRFHDLMHMYQPDYITRALVEHIAPAQNIVIETPLLTVVECKQPISVLEVINQLKDDLNLSTTKLVGDEHQLINRIGVSVGFRGGGEQLIPEIDRLDLDLMIYGEGHEWETPEYVRDAQALGVSRNVLVIGHYESEAPGIKKYQKVLQAAFPAIPVHYIDSGSPFRTHN